MECKIGIGAFLFVCLVAQVRGAVNCTATGTGRFADPADTTCKNYTLCVYNTNNASFLSYSYTCPTTSLFNPNSAQCTANYTCTVTSTNNSNSVCTAEGYIADLNSTNCTSYIECVQINRAFVETTYTCPDGTYYNPNTTFCEADYKCPISTFSCTAAGRFADPADTTCQSYFFCVLATNGTYLEYSYTCPTTSLFNPNSAHCTVNYTCTVTSTNTSKSVCIADGYTADLNSTNCAAYIECVQINGTFVETTYTCPDGTYYNPNTTFCEADYKCPISTFSCTAAGRFADTTDTTCQSYFFCVLASNGTYVEYSYTCPTASVFSPTARVCTTSYTCDSKRTPPWII